MENTTLRADATAQARTTKNTPKTFVRRDIQGLRAFAVLAVILDHLFGWPTGGFVGVDVFFVVSGYLITGLLLREYERSGTLSFVGFYRRRIENLPAAVLVLVAVVVASWFLTPGVRFVRTAQDSLWAFLFSANWNMGLQGTDYFQRDILPSPVQHFWSLSIEEQFYFVWPWLMLAVLLVGVRRLRWSPLRARVAAGVAIGVLSFISFGYAMVMTAADPNWAYFSSFTRVWELGLGALVVILGVLFTRPAPVLRNVLGWVGFIGIMVSFFLISENGFPAPGAALPVVATALVLLAGENSHQRSLVPLTNPVAKYVGDISYSLYLWHWPIIILLLAVIPGGTPMYFGVAIALILGLSIGAYHLVENPIRKSGWLTEGSSARARRRRRKRRRGRRGPSRTNPWALAGLGALTLAVAGLVTFTAFQFAPNDTGGTQSGGSSLLAEQAAEREAAQEQFRCRGAAKLDPSSGCEAVDLGTTVWPTPDRAVADKEKLNGKDLCWIAGDQRLSHCEYGSKAQDALKVAIVGDSHAQSLLSSMLDTAITENWAIDAYIGDSCLLTVEEFEKCAVAQPAILDAVSQPGAYDVVITHSARSKRGDPQSHAEAFQRVIDSGTKLVVIDDVPRTTEEAILCYQRLGFDPTNNDCKSELPRDDDPLIQAAALVEGVTTLDLTPYLCTAESCPAVVGNVIVYRDAGAHLTETYAKSLAPYVIPAIKTKLGL